MLTINRTQPYNVNEAFTREAHTSDGYTMPYRLYIPKNYDCGELYPVVLFLHGAGERGSDNEKQLSSALQHLFDDMDSPIYNAIVIAPQCPADKMWISLVGTDGTYALADAPETRELECVLEILDLIADSYNVDADRVYVTGLSMGGFATWELLSRHGARFAAGLPICGGGIPSYAKLLTRIPIMTYHGSEDPIVPVTGTRIMYASIVKEGGELISYTEFDGAGHDIWDRVYSTPGAIRWLFEQSREERRLKAEKKEKLKKTAIAAGGGVGVLLSILLLIVKKKKKR